MQVAVRNAGGRGTVVCMRMLFDLWRTYRSCALCSPDFFSFLQQVGNQSSSGRKCRGEEPSINKKEKKRGKAWHPCWLHWFPVMDAFVRLIFHWVQPVELTRYGKPNPMIKSFDDRRRRYLSQVELSHAFVYGRHRNNRPSAAIPSNNWRHWLDCMIDEDVGRLLAAYNLITPSNRNNMLLHWLRWAVDRPIGANKWVKCVRTVR